MFKHFQTDKQKTEELFDQQTRQAVITPATRWLWVNAKYSGGNGGKQLKTLIENNVQTLFEDVDDRVDQQLSVVFEIYDQFTDIL